MAIAMHRQPHLEFANLRPFSDTGGAIPGGGVPSGGVVPGGAVPKG